MNAFLFSNSQNSIGMFFALWIFPDFVFSLSISLSVCLSSQRNANAPSVSSLIGTTSHPTYKTMDLVENLPDYFRCFLKKLYRFAVGTVPRVMDHRRSFTTKNVNQTSCE